MRSPIRTTLLVSACLAALSAAVAAARRGRPAPPLPVALPPDRRASARRIVMAGAGNLRDLGGYQSSDGRTVRWGVLYRSDSLHRLTRRDLATFARMGLRTLIDFRSEAERTTRPNRLPADHGIRVVEIPIFDEHNNFMVELRERYERRDLAGIDPVAVLSAAYEEFVANFTPAYRRYIGELLAAKGAPLLFHCTAGKDRTGFAAAITLRLLGVPEETILADYLLSTERSLASNRHALTLVRLTRGRAVADLMRGLLSVEAAYLHAAFAAIDRDYGSFAAYVREGLGLSDDDLVRLRSYLLEG